MSRNRIVIVVPDGATPSRPPTDPEAERIVRDARAKALYLRPYFARALLALILRESDFVPTMATDEYGRLYYNPAFVKELSIEEAAVVFLHEIGHPLQQHFRRARAQGVTIATAAIANSAQDATINSVLRQEHKDRKDIPMLPGDPWYPERIRDKNGRPAPEGEVWETYYHMMLESPDYQQMIPEIVFISTSMGDGSEQDGGGGEGDQPSQSKGRGKGKKSGQGQGVSHGHDCGSAAHGVKRPWEEGAPGRESEVYGLDDGDWRDIRQEVAKAIRERKKSRGDVPGTWVAWADDVLKPQRIPWEHELGSGIRWAINDVSGMVIHSYKRPSRRQQAVPDVVLPTMRRPIPFVCIVGDTSGSMSDEALKLVRGTVEDIATAIGARVAFLATDAEVHGGIQMVHEGRGIKLAGRGGTDMRIGIDYALTHLRPTPDVIVVITDLATPWPEKAPERCRVIIAAVEADESCSGIPEWAKVVHVHFDEER